MPVGSEQNEPTNLLGWEPWLQATPGQEGSCLLVAAGSGRRHAGQGTGLRTSGDRHVPEADLEPRSHPASNEPLPASHFQEMDLVVPVQQQKLNRL